MLHRLTGSDPLVFIIHQHFAKQVQAFWVATVLVFVVDKRSPRHYISAFNQSCCLCRQVESVCAQVILEPLSTKHVDNPRQLIEVVSPFEKSINFK